MATPIKRKPGRPRKQAPATTPITEDLADIADTATAYTVDTLLDAVRTFMRILEQYPPRARRAAVTMLAVHFYVQSEPEP